VAGKCKGDERLASGASSVPGSPRACRGQVNASAPFDATRRSTPSKLRVYEEEYADCNWVVA